MILKPSKGRVNSVSDLYCCRLLSRWFNVSNRYLSLVLASVVQDDAHPATNGSQRDDGWNPPLKVVLSLFYAEFVLAMVESAFTSGNWERL